MDDAWGWKCLHPWSLTAKFHAVNAKNMPSLNASEIFYGVSDPISFKVVVKLSHYSRYKTNIFFAPESHQRDWKTIRLPIGWNGNLNLDDYDRKCSDQSWWDQWGEISPQGIPLSIGKITHRSQPLILTFLGHPSRWWLSFNPFEKYAQSSNWIISPGVFTQNIFETNT